MAQQEVQQEVNYAQYEDLHLLRVISGMKDQSHDPEPWTTRTIAQQTWSIAISLIPVHWERIWRIMEVVAYV
jgi:hypothetical protein